METYDFSLRLGVPVTSSVHTLVERLGAIGCTDAVIGLGLPGCLRLDFARDARCGYEALMSALEQVKRAIPDAQLIECEFRNAAPPGGCGSFDL